MLEERRIEEEKRRLAEADRKAEEKRKREAEEAKRKAEEEKRKAEEAKRKAELEKQKAEQEKRAAEEAALKAEMDKMLQESLAAEQREQEERRVKGVVEQYATIIKQRIKRYWIKPANSQDGLQCTLRVTLLPGGDVKQVNVIKSSGNPVFDRSAESAVYKAAPLPQPTDPKAAAALRDFQFIFKPE
jgi:colicin import membrane protein